MDIVLIEAMAKTRKPTGDMAAADAGDAWSTKRCKVPSPPVLTPLGLPSNVSSRPPNNTLNTQSRAQQTHSRSRSLQAHPHSADVAVPLLHTRKLSMFGREECGRSPGGLPSLAPVAFAAVPSPSSEIAISSDEAAIWRRCTRAE
eukprot:scaffold137244_cov99-Phaeocystis_antarctica.AAC.2